MSKFIPNRRATPAQSLPPKQGEYFPERGEWSFSQERKGGPILIIPKTPESAAKPAAAGWIVGLRFNPVLTEQSTHRITALLLNAPNLWRQLLANLQTLLEAREMEQLVKSIDLLEDITERRSAGFFEEMPGEVEMLTGFNNEALELIAAQAAKDGAL